MEALTNALGGYTGDLHSNLNLENRNDLFQCRLDKCMWQKLDVQGEIVMNASPVDVKYRG